MVIVQLTIYFQTNVMEMVAVLGATLELSAIGYFHYFQFETFHRIICVIENVGLRRYGMDKKLD